MAKIILKYEAAVLKEIPLKQATLSIGRTAANDLPIDNLAVSGHHAKIYFEADKFVLEDLNSLNGTFVNNQRIRKSFLKNGDEVLIGKHTLVYMDEGGAPPPPPELAADRTMPMAKMEETMVLDTKKRREMLQKATVVATDGASAAPAAEKVGSLTVLAGKTDNHEYILTGRLSMIGKSDQATIKLKGWFAPAVAAVINRKEAGYTVSPSGSETKVNGQVTQGVRELKEGDIIEVAGTKLQFYYRE
jgi:pSer/pThr/pTyr-binding forkhead associated (FHA) protein